MPLPQAPPAALLGARLARPCLTRQLASLLRWSVIWRYPETGDPLPVRAPNWEPPPIDDGALAEARAQIAALERYLAPVDDLAWLNQRIATWLAQGRWVDELDEGAQAMVLADWAALLRPFPKWAIAAAARAEMGRTSRYTLADAVAACTREVADARAERDALRRLVDPREQERALARARQREEEERREAERVAFVAANPDWSPLKDALRRVVEAHQQGDSDAQGSS